MAFDVARDLIGCPSHGYPCLSDDCAAALLLRAMDELGMGKKLIPMRGGTDGAPCQPAESRPPNFSPGDRLSYLLGLPAFVLAGAVALPIPFRTLIPVVAICFMAIGLIERDGLVVLLGLLLTAVALVATLFLLQGAALLFASM